MARFLHLMIILTGLVASLIDHLSFLSTKKNGRIKKIHEPKSLIYFTCLYVFCMIYKPFCCLKMIVIITATAKKFLVVTFLMDSEVTNSTVCYCYYKLDQMKNDPLKLLKYAVIIFEDPEETCGLLMTQQFPNFG